MLLISSFILDEQTSQRLAIRLLWGAISLRVVAAEHDADLTRIVFSLNSLFIFLKSLLMSRRVEVSSVLDECWAAPGQFRKPFQRHVLKWESYITYYKNAQF